MGSEKIWKDEVPDESGMKAAALTRNSEPSKAAFDDAVMKLKQTIAEMELQMRPIVNEQKNEGGDDKLKLKEENYFGRLSELFIRERILKKPGDYAISRTHDDIIRFSVMSESCRVYHLLVVEVNGTYSFENSIYPLATSVASLIRKCIRSSMNVLSAILGTNVILRQLVDPKTEDKDNYSLFGLFLGSDDIVKKNCLISKGNIADSYLGKLYTFGESEPVVIKVMHSYDEDELNNICRELHISNMLQRFMSVDSVMPVRCAQISRAPYMVIYPFMNCGSYLDFALRMGSQLDFAEKLEVAKTIARALADMHFLGLLHCDIGARNIFVRKELVANSKAVGYPPPSNYKYYLGDFREAYIGKVKKVNPRGPINIRWLAPEVFRTNQLTEATDVFAWGVTLYEIFTGNLPYFSMSSDQIRTKLLAGCRIRPETRNVDLPQKILNLMRRCWRTNVSERPTMDGVWLRLRTIHEKTTLPRKRRSESDISGIS